ncbi:MAG: chromosome segregation protein SMC [Zetaproteobacteria bacterium]|nr:MAG: chromosome segregation protein SMC [Zetaproteobacteria bacterium]
MRIRKLKLVGFKSFADPTEIALGPGVNVVVGPNGCGKSNIVDALRWVLGEHSAHRLRGEVMEHLIFEGSEARPPAPTAEVAMQLAATPGELPPPFEKLAELEIKRRVAREAGSDVWINGRAARIRDVVELFANTGAGARAYAIIEQGRVSELITMKPEARRALLEEAAGIARYRLRKEEAERRMRRIEEDLVRVRDRLSEAKRRVRHLAQQAETAQRYRALQEEMEKVKAAVFAHRAARLKEEIEAGRAKLQALAQQLEAKQAQAAAHEAKLAELERMQSELERERAEAESSWRAVERAFRELQRKLDRLVQERAHAEREEADLRRSIARHAERLDELARRLADAESAQPADDLAALKKAVAEAQAKADAAERELVEAQAAYDRAVERLAAAKAALEAKVDARRKLAQRRAQIQERLQAHETRLEELAARKAEAEQALEKLRRLVEEAEASLTAQEAQLAEAERAHGNLSKKMQELEQAAKQAEIELHRVEAQLAKLWPLVEPPEDVQAWLARAKDQGAHVLDEISVPEGMERALAAAAGRPFAVLCDPDLARRLKDDVPQDVALFVAPSEQATVPGSLAEALGLAADAVWYPVFARVRWVAAIEQAPASAEVVVDAQGWRRDPHGAWLPPAVERAAQRWRAKREAQALEQERARLRARLGELQEQIRDLAAQRERAERTLKDARKRVADARRQLEQQRLEQARAEHRLTVAEEALRQAQEAHASVAQELEALAAQAEHDIAPEEEARKAAEAELEQASARLAEAQQRHRACLSALHQREGELARARERLEALARRTEEIRKDMERERQWRAELEEKLARCQQRQKRAEAEIPTYKEALAAQREQQKASEARLAELRRREAELERERRQALNALHALRRALEAEQMQRAKEEADLEHLAREHASLLEECRAHFGCAPEELRADASVPPEQAEARLQALAARLERFGPVNLLAIEEYDQAKEEEAFLLSQLEDLEKGLASVRRTIREIERTARERLVETFTQADAHFRELFPKLFGGGRAQLRWVGEDPLTAGIAIHAQPPGKRLQELGLLSGGEKALTACALIFALFLIRPAPFCVLDEVDAPLDDVNVARFAALVREMAEDVQFLVITHNKTTMQHADRLIGISMPEPGVSRVLSVSLEEAQALVA